MSAPSRRAVVADRLKQNGLWLTPVLSLGVLVGLIAFGDVGAVRAAFAAFEWRAFVLLVALATGGYVVRFLKWELYLRTLSIDVPLRTSAVTFFSGLMFVVTPGKAGEVWKAGFLNDLQGVSASRITSVVGAERVTDLLALGLMAALGPLAYGRSGIGVVVLFATVGTGIVLLQWRSLCLRVLRTFETTPVVGAYATVLKEFYESTYTLFQPGPFLRAMVLSIVAWTLEGMALWVALDGYDAAGSLLQSVFVYGLGLLVGGVSMLPGGLGATEASMVGLLLSFGYERSIAVSTVLILRVGTLWYAVLLGLIVYVTHKIKATRY